MSNKRGQLNALAQSSLVLKYMRNRYFSSQLVSYKPKSGYQEDSNSRYLGLKLIAKLALAANKLDFVVLCIVTEVSNGIDLGPDLIFLVFYGNSETYSRQSPRQISFFNHSIGPNCRY